MKKANIPHITIVVTFLLLTSCSSYKLVDTDDCSNVSGSIKLCREVE